MINHKHKLLAISLFIETVGLERTSDQKPNAQYLTAHPLVCVVIVIG